MVKKKDSDKIYAMKVLKKEQVATKNLRVKTKGKSDSKVSAYNE